MNMPFVFRRTKTATDLFRMIVLFRTSFNGRKPSPHLHPRPKHHLPSASSANHQKVFVCFHSTKVLYSMLCADAGSNHAALIAAYEKQHGNKRRKVSSSAQADEPTQIQLVVEPDLPDPWRKGGVSNLF